MDKKLIVIAGPTATGKSAVAVELARLIDGEIVSADSMQVYKYMDIGTAKPPKEDMALVRHHLIDIVEPDYSFNAAVFTDLARTAIDDIISRGKYPILVGGTGFYINALVYNNDFSQTVTEKTTKLRENLYKTYESKSPEEIFADLVKVDPEYALTTHANNVKRVLRALEYYYETGEKFSAYNERNKQNREKAYDFSMFVLNRDREKMYNAINVRVDKMVEAGLIAEVKGLLDMGHKEDLTSMQGLGYKEICAYFNNEVSLDEAIENIKLGTRRFAKRQITWFKNQTDATWLDIDKYNNTAHIAAEISGNILK